MHFMGKPFLPGPPEFGAYLAEIRQYLALARHYTPEFILATFFGLSLDAASFHIDGLHHVAIYGGDYRREEDLEVWFDHVGGAQGVSRLRSGPSYIAPRRYGTPGYWFNCQLDGFDLEMFFNKHAGPWRDCTHGLKVSRMSHCALRVSEADHVVPLLEYFAHYPDIELLASSPRDELGHTYGHLMNTRTQCVLELVHEGGL